MHKLIPDIENKIERTLARLNLEPKVSAKEFIKKTKGAKHRYSSLCKNNKGEKTIFYARLHDNKDAKTKMLREISFFKKSKNLKISKYIPEVRFSKKEKGLEWLNRQYFKTPVLGLNERLDKTIKSKDIKAIAKSISDLKNTKLETLTGVPLIVFPIKNYLKSRNQLPDLVKEKILSPARAKKIEEFIERNKSLLEEENKYFCHGDFNLGNIIISSKTVKIIDWESIQVNNLSFDTAYLFTHLWQAPKTIRKTLISAYLSLLAKKEKRTFKQLFPVIIYYLSVQGVKTKPKEIKPEMLKKRKEFFQKLLQNAPDFDKLANI